MNKVSVIIPAYNEEKNIGNVIETIRKGKIEKEIIVVDNCSTDNTSEKAAQYGVEKIVYCENQGKGYAMETGLRYAENDIVAFFDGDLEIETNYILDDIVNPILYDGFDFVKSTFEREGGRVTELVAKPLLELLFPNIYKFRQPLSGIIAGRTSVLKKVTFEKDYAVDIGILLDMINLNMKIKEVYVGKINNCSKSWNSLPKMSKEVARGILSRAYSDFNRGDK